MKFFVFLILYSSVSFAWEIRLDRTNHSGFRAVDVLEFEKGDYFFNGKNLGKKLPPQVFGSWKEIENRLQQRPPHEVCFAGSYVLLKKENNKERRYEACSEGESYGRLIKNFEDIRQYAKEL